MLLQHRCSQQFDSAVKSRGREYFETGCIQLDRPSGTSVDAKVKGSYVYDVELDWSEVVDDDLLAAYCSCPHFADGNLCKHIWATLLAMDAAGYAARVPGTELLIVIGDDDDSYDDEFDDGLDDDDDWDVDGYLSAPSRSTTTQVRRRANSHRVGLPAVTTAVHWKDALQGLQNNNGQAAVSPQQSLKQALNYKQRLMWCEVDVANTMGEGELFLDLLQQEKLSDGSWGPRKRISINSDGVDQFPDPVDREFLQAIFEYGWDEHSGSNYASQYYHRSEISNIWIPSHAFTKVLPSLCDSGRVFWTLTDDAHDHQDRALRWDGDQPWEFVPYIQTHPSEKRWTIDGCLRQGDKERPLNDIVFALKYGLVQFSDSLGPFSCDAYGLMQQILVTGPVKVPHREKNAFLDQLIRTPLFGHVELPDDLQPDRADIPPRPFMQLNAPDHQYRRSGYLEGTVRLRYGEHEILPGNQQTYFYDRDKQQFIMRDRDAEQQFLQQLTSLPLRFERRYYDQKGEFLLDYRQLHEVVEKLLESGWDVEAEQALFRKAGNFDIQVESGVDWFDVNATVEYDGEVVALPKLLSALRRGEKYVKLGDGSKGILPEEWLAKWGGLAQADSDDDDAVRFGRSQALLLDALLAEQENVKTDRSFRALRDKLRNFRGIEAATAPRGFQGELRKYQNDGLGWLNFLQQMEFGGCLADDMGLGKTVQVLALLQQRRARRLCKNEQRLPSLCVVPKSLVFNWVDEAQRFAPRLNVINYTGIERKQYNGELDECDLIVTTYGTLRRDIEDFKDRRFDYAILDEATAIKNANSQSAKACRLLGANHRLALTGTPVENHLGELWSLFEFINPGMLGRSSAFTSVCKRSRNGDDGEELAQLSKAIAPFVLRRTKKEVLTDLPDKTEHTIVCELSKTERKEYNELRDFYRAKLRNDIEDVGLKKAKFHVLEALLRLRQAACHPGLIDNKKKNKSSAKLDALLEQIEEVIAGDKKALVFSQFTSLLAIVRERLDKKGITYEYLDGKTTKRKQKVDRFQSDADCPLFLISLKAGGHGLNLTAAEYVFILDPWWNPAVEAQAIDRSHRIGQKQKVFAYRLIAKDTVEEKVIELQKQKRELADAIVSANESLIRKMTADDLQRILE